MKQHNPWSLLKRALEVLPEGELHAEIDHALYMRNGRIKAINKADNFSEELHKNGRDPLKVDLTEEELLKMQAIENDLKIFLENDDPFYTRWIGSYLRVMKRKMEKENG